MLRPHHTCICTDVYMQNGRLFLDPELWTRAHNLQDLKTLKEEGYVETEDYMPVRENSDFIIIQDGLFEYLQGTSYLSYTIFAENEYLEDTQYWHYDNWSKEVNLSSMTLLGWTVYSYIEPAILFGDYPIQPVLDGEQVVGYNIQDYAVINEWGLLRDYDSAQEVVLKNKTQDSLYNETELYSWRSLAVCVDRYTLLKLKGILKRIKPA